MTRSGSTTRYSSRALILVMLTGFRSAEVGVSLDSELPGEDALASISQEISFLSESVTGGKFLLVLSALSVALLVTVLVSRLMHRFRRRHRLRAPEITIVSLLLGAALIGFALVVAFRYLSLHIPVVATIGAGAAAAGLAFVLFRQFPSWVVGFGLVIRRSLREGDLLQIGETRGVVDKIGIMRLILVDADGARVHLGLGDIGQGPITIASPTKEHLVEYVHRHPEDLTEASVTLIRTVAVLSPFRIAKGKVRIEISKENPHEVRVRFHTWSEEAKDRALVHLKRALSNETGG